MSKQNENAGKDTVKAYLDRRAAADKQFAASYAKPAKNIDECWRYILSEARKRGNAVYMTDEEVFGLAVHYYDEDDLKVPTAAHEPRLQKSTKAPEVKLSEAEKAAAREEAIRRYQAECMAEAAAKEKERSAKKKRPSGTVEDIPSLFGDF